MINHQYLSYLVVEVEQEINLTTNQLLDGVMEVPEEDSKVQELIQILEHIQQLNKIHVSQLNQVVLDLDKVKM